MGLGSIGSVVADVVAALGFNVIAWTRSEGRAARVPVFVGEQDLLDQMLAWVPDEAQRHRILVSNAEALYGL